MIMTDPAMTDSANALPVALILAGGLARRMGGGDKPLIEVEGRSLLDRVVERLRPQAETILLNVNGAPERYQSFALPMVPDVVDGYAGPLVGVLTGLEWMRANAPDRRWLLTVAADTPLFPDDLTARMMEAVTREGAKLACARTGAQAHPVFGLWSVELLDDLRHAVVEEGARKIDAWTARHGLATVEWPTTPHDPFFNVNTPEDVIRLRLILNGEMPESPPLREEAPVSVVVARRDSSHPWKTEDWRPVAVVAEPAPGPEWMELTRVDGGEDYLANGLTLELHRSDLASYRYNLESGEPRLVVGLRRNEDGDEEGGYPVRIALISAALDEGGLLSDNPEDVVETVPMPAALVPWVTRFCAMHPPSEPMRKRKRDKADADEAFGRTEGGKGGRRKERRHDR